MSHSLCLERLNRLLRVLDRLGGSATIRDLERGHGIWWWEVEQAEELGWIRVFTRKGSVGRPAEVIDKLNKTPSAKYPLPRHMIPREIKWSHQRFAMISVTPIAKNNRFGFGLPSMTTAYLMTYPKCRSRNAAAVGASRLMKRLDVRLMRHWLFAEINKKLSGPMPLNVPGLIEQLDSIGAIRYVRRS